MTDCIRTGYAVISSRFCVKPTGFSGSRRGRGELVKPANSPWPDPCFGIMILLTLAPYNSTRLHLDPQVTTAHQHEVIPCQFNGCVELARYDAEGPHVSEWCFSTFRLWPSTARRRRDYRRHLAHACLNVVSFKCPIHVADTDATELDGFVASTMWTESETVGDSFQFSECLRL